MGDRSSIVDPGVESLSLCDGPRYVTAKTVEQITLSLEEVGVFEFASFEKTGTGDVGRNFDNRKGKSGKKNQKEFN